MGGKQNSRCMALQDLMLIGQATAHSLTDIPGGAVLLAILGKREAPLQQVWLLLAVRRHLSCGVASMLAQVG